MSKDRPFTSTGDAMPAEPVLPVPLPLPPPPVRPMPVPIFPPLVPERTPPIDDNNS